jgi:hypothetical protein
MNSSKRRAYALALACAFVVSACGQTKTVDQGSQVEQIFASVTMACEANQTLLPGVDQRYRSHVSASSARDTQDALNALSVLPEPYLNWVIKGSNLKINVTNNIGGGFTTWSGQKITSMQVGRKATNGNYYSLRHEVGHAVHVYLSNNVQGFSTDWSTAYRSAMNSESKYMRSYSRTSQQEYFADLFDSFYCGSVSHEKVKAEMPVSFAFAQKYLIPFEQVNANSNPSNGNLALFLGKLEADSSFPVFVSDSGNASEVRLCQGTKAECVTPTVQPIVLSYHSTVGTLKIFKSQLLNLQQNQTYTLIAFENGSAARQSSFKVTPKN